MTCPRHRTEHVAHHGHADGVAIVVQATSRRRGAPMLAAAVVGMMARTGELPGVAAAGAARIGAWARATRSLVRLALRLLFRVRLEGTPPRSGGYLLVANHQGWADPFLLLALLPAEPRLYFVGDRQAVSHRWWKRLVVRSLGLVVPVARDGSSERGAIEAVLGLLEEGAVVAIFAEGRVSRAEAQLAPFQRGVGYLAMKAQVPVVPVWLRGTAELYLGRELTARVGPACEAPSGEPTKPATTAFAEELHARLAAIATPWTEPPGVRKRWRWLTDIL